MKINSGTKKAGNNDPNWKLNQGDKTRSYILRVPFDINYFSPLPEVITVASVIGIEVRRGYETIFEISKIQSTKDYTDIEISAHDNCHIENIAIGWIAYQP